jgi:hypothetical protein
MKYPVLNDFIEKYHKNTLYKKGEIYPKEGFKADPERVAFLQSNKNRYGVAFLGPEIKENDKEAEDTEEVVQEEVASLDEHVEESSDEAETDEAGTAKKGGKNNSRKRKPAEK